MTPAEYAKKQYEKAVQNLADTALLYVRGYKPQVTLQDLRTAVERLEKADHEHAVTLRMTKGAEQHG